MLSEKTKKNIQPGFPRKVMLKSMVFALAFLLPSLAMAAATETELGGVTSFNDFISAAWKWGSGVVFAISVIAIIVGGIMMTSSGGNEDRADMGRMTVRGAIIGIFITLFSGVFNTFIKSPVDQGNRKSLGDIFNDLNNAASALTSVVGALAGLGIVYAGIKYMTAGGDEEKMDSAKRALRMSLYGAGVALSAWAISSFLLHNS